MATTDKSGLSITPLYLIDPDGVYVPIAPTEVVPKTRGFTLVKTLPPEPQGGVSGTWRVVIAADPGPQGHFRYTFRLQEPLETVYRKD